MRDFFYEPLRGWQPYEELLEGAKRNQLITAFGMAETQKTLLAAALTRETGRQALFVVSTEAGCTAAWRCSSPSRSARRVRLSPRLNRCSTG